MYFLPLRVVTDRDSGAEDDAVLTGLRTIAPNDIVQNTSVRDCHDFVVCVQIRGFANSNFQPAPYCAAYTEQQQNEEQQADGITAPITVCQVCSLR